MNTGRIRVPEWEAVKSFYINWDKALNDGWIISDGMVIPPVGHKARDWCAYWYPTKSGIRVPSWFKDFYPINDDEYLQNVEEPIEIGTMIVSKEVDQDKSVIMKSWLLFCRAYCHIVQWILSFC